MPSDECPHRPTCPGCPRFGVHAPAASAWQRVCELARAAGLDEPEFHQTPGRGHRHRARLAVRGRSRSPKIGLFQAGSHRIVDTPNCPIHHPLINDAACALKSAIRETGIEPYADRPHLGALRYAQFVVERSTMRVQVVLVGRGDDSSVLGALPEALARKLGADLQGLFFNAQPERTNAIFGPHMIHLDGEQTLREELGGVHTFFPPAAFGQNHLPLYERAIERIHDLVSPDAIVAEMYCGVGSIGLGLLETTREVRFNERSPDGLAGLALGLEDRPISERARAKVLPGPANERLGALEGAHVVIVDPPRRGLDSELCARLATDPPARLIYLACGLDRLIDDLQRLTTPGKLRVSGIETFDFFPYTEHIETLVWLDANRE